MAQGDTQYSLKQTNDHLEFFIHSGGSWISATAPFPDDWLGKEHHVAGVFDAAAGTLTLYIDGQAVAPGPPTAPDQQHRAAVARHRRRQPHAGLHRQHPGGARV